MAASGETWVMPFRVSASRISFPGQGTSPFGSVPGFHQGRGPGLRQGHPTRFFANSPSGCGRKPLIFRTSSGEYACRTFLYRHRTRLPIRRRGVWYHRPMARRMYKPNPARTRARRAPEPVPEDLRHLVAFVNARELESPEALSDWLSRRGLLPRGTELSDDDLERAREARAGLRSLIGAAAEDVASGLLNRAASDAAVRVRFEADGSARFEPASANVGGALGRLFATVVLARAEGFWSRLKICEAEACGQAFYDASNNRRGRWCSRACGNRYAARGYRDRRKEAGRPPPPSA